MEWLSTLSLALGSAWTSGINLYATVFTLGLLQKLGVAKLPGGLETLDNWWIIGVAAGLYSVEFIADKVPYVDSVWDVIHTFVRVPAGAILAYSAVADFQNPAVQPVALLLGGSVALSSHGTKTAARAFANLSPEPVSNWVLSIVEDVIAFVGAILAVLAPLVIGVVVVVFMAIFLRFLPRIVRAVRRVLTSVSAFLRGDKTLAAAARKSA